ncbi:MAG: hypothetical protein AB7H66_10275 [Hyphomonadaceae bacterium]
MSRPAVFAAAVICAGSAFAETRYFTQIEDLPIAPGLEEIDQRLEFSDPDIRLVSASAQGRAEAEHVRSYYQSALPALGWALSIGSGGENETVYLRGREQLSLSFHQRGEHLWLQALLFSRSPPHD